jgi:membrane peptidoglycan carboxypeptidase
MVTSRRLTVAGRVALLIRAGLIAGLVITGLSYPFAALAGMGVKAGAEALESMPEQLTERPPAQTTYVYAGDGKTLLTMFYEEHRKHVDLDDMSPYLIKAIVASEDSRFYEHNGVDAKGVARAFVANQKAGGVSQGASTLTMQYVRMALRDGARTPREALEATEQTAARKLREMRLAIEVEQRLSKEEILERPTTGIAPTASSPPPRSSSPSRRAISASPRPHCSPGSSRRRPRTTRPPRTRRPPWNAATTSSTRW